MSLKTEFKRLGFGFKRKTICTIELSKKLIPGQDSYSLGKLARSLGIPVTDRHRASGDAMATVKLFKMLLTKDLEKFIVQDAIRLEPKYQMEPNLKQIINLFFKSLLERLNLLNLIMTINYSLQ